MQQVKPAFKILSPMCKPESVKILKRVEWVARECYKSQHKITEDSYIKFLTGIRNRKHTAMLEQGDMVVYFTMDRGVSHELVRHRLASYAQESTRYCDYGGKGIQVVLPCDIEADLKTEKGKRAYAIWLGAMVQDQQNYDALRDLGYPPQIARSVLPTCLKTGITIKANFTEWRHIFRLRTDVTAHPDMRYLMRPLLERAKARIPVMFDDIIIAS
jgi:thymidylate synthase (FAD)